MRSKLAEVAWYLSLAGLIVLILFVLVNITPFVPFFISGVIWFLFPVTSIIYLISLFLGVIGLWHTTKYGLEGTKHAIWAIIISVIGIAIIFGYIVYSLASHPFL